MTTTEQTSDVARFFIENVGGITETEINIPPGTTVLSGENATNRTSLLQAIMAVMGSDKATLKGDANEGRVRLSIGDGTYERVLTRTGDGLVINGEGYLDHVEVADLFAFLLETNEARQAVARRDDLRGVIMRPVDTEAIQQEIDRLKAERTEIDNELNTIESRKEDLPELEQRRSTLRDRIDEKRATLAEVEGEIDDHSRDVEESRQEQDELEAKLEELRETRSDLERVRRNIETQQASITSLEQERKEVENDLADLPETPMGDHADLEVDIDRLRDERQELNAEINELRSLIKHNEERLEEGDYDVLDAIDTEGADSDDAVTDQLLADEAASVVCWTCGSTVEREQIEGTLDRLRELRSQNVTELNDVKDDLEALKAEQQEAQRAQRRRDDLEEKLRDVEDELERRRTQVESLRDRRDELTDEVERREANVEELESEDFEEILDLHKQANQHEFELDRLESNLEEVTDEIEEIERMIDRADDLRTERDDLLDDLEDQRMKIDRIEANAVEQFNEHMDAILDILSYENLERVWIERVTRTVREGRGTVEQTAFDLHVVRTTESGTAYEDTVDHLSESEREVTGLVFALAGYLVHDLYETVPFMLLDSLEAIDAGRIADLVAYFADYAEYLVVALLEEDAQALDTDYHRITGI
jgi:DNA repair exonuclease SbcCD ATPase subunit